MHSNFRNKFGFILGALLLGALLFFYHKHGIREDSDRSNIKNSGDEVETPIQNFLVDQKEMLESAKKLKRGDVPLISPQGLSDSDLKKWNVFKQILQSRNDNDPRLDTDLRKLTPEMHKAIMQEYQSLPMESRNERGLAAFLIARDLQNFEDVAFLKAIYDESPCLSLENCSTRGENDPHHSGGEQVTQNYPQMATLYQIEKQLQSSNKILEDPKIKEALQDLLRSASRFTVPMVSQKAESILNRR